MSSIIDFLMWDMTKRGWETIKQKRKQKNCPHTDWDMDNQIRVIRCRECGKEAWVRDIKNLYPSTLTRRK